jgi:5-methylcytosine-specific restriction endonuclease McrA
MRTCKKGLHQYIPTHRATGRSLGCQQCTKIWQREYDSKIRKTDKVKEKEYARKHYYKDVTRSREKQKIATNKFMLAHTEELKKRGSTYRKKYAENNKGKILARVRVYKIQKLKRTPGWLSKEQKKQIEEFYILAKELQWLSDEPLQVDHIIPLRGKNVSGLHVPWNLQILPSSANRKKSNNAGK